MSVKMLFVVGAPRSGTTMLERMLSSHSMVQGGPEPHLLTPLAHLGVWDNVLKAPYDHVLAGEAQKGFIAQLPQGEADYWAACRAYCDVLYGRYLQGAGEKSICMDKTPAYGLILPFLAKVFPDAKYVVLSRHPLAMFSSYANSFFDGDYTAAQGYNPIVDRYVPALAAFVRRGDVSALHVRYEDLVAEPERWFECICRHVEIPFEKEAIDYGKGTEAAGQAKGLGDPIGVARHSRPTTASVKKWAQELASDPAKRIQMEATMNRLSLADLDTLGYPLDTLWQPLEEAAGAPPPTAPKLTRYRLQRRMIIRLRARARQNGLFRALLKKARLTCDVLLREQ
jgi:hypothetical protein